MIVRPLSAKKLPMTIPEKEGWIDREQFADITGRSRKQQMAMAKDYNINDYPCPAGGCLLTDPLFSKRVRDLIEFGPYDIANAELLKVGRHFRLNAKLKLIVGRNEKENHILNTFACAEDLVLDPLNAPGPTGLLRGSISNKDKDVAAKIITKYTKVAEKLTISLKHAKDTHELSIDKEKQMLSLKKNGARR